MRDKVAGWPRRWLLSLLVVFLLGPLVALAEGGSPKEPRLLGYSSIPPVTVSVNEEERRWLREHKTVNVGVVPHDFVPFDLIDLDNAYEGISADYLEAITDALEMGVHIKVFRTRREATVALEQGAVDVLTSEPLSLVDRTKFSLSAAYYSLRHVEVTSIAQKVDRQGEINVGYVAGHVSTAAMKEAYPNAKLIPYRSPFLGVVAMADRKVDIFVGVSAGVSYLMEHFQLPNLRVSNFPEDAPDSMHFAFRQDNRMLRQVFDRALEVLPLRARADVKARWAPTYQENERFDRIALTEAERQWISTHPVVRYSTMNDFMPFMFLDHAGRYVGLTLQVIDKMAFETGLSFEPVANKNDEATAADIFPAVIRGQKNILPDMMASTPYFRDHSVIVARVAEQDFLRVETLAGKRIAYFPPNSVAQTIKEKVPNVTLIQADSVAETYDFVAQGRADVTIGNIDSANYLIAQGHANQLRVAGSVDDAPVDIAFGVRADQPELLSIINKALEGIPADEMRRIRSNGMFFSRPATDWSTYIRWLYVFGGVLVVCLGLFAVWNRSLKKEVHRRQVAEAELNDQLEFQRAMLEGVPYAIAVRDAQARLIFCNAAFERLFQVSRQTVMGKTLIESNVTDAPIALVRTIHERYMRLMTHGGAITEDLDVVVGGVKKRILHWAAPLSRKTKKERVGFVTGAIDLTERHHLVELIESARAKAEAANRAKSNFLATMSHEIRTPMNAVMGMLELLVREGRLVQEDRDSAELARSSAKGLLSLIDDILDISKIEAGGLEVVPRPAQLRPIIYEVANVFESLARQRGLSISVDIDEAVAQWHAVDAPRFRQIVNNLVSNAIKYTDEGSIKVTLRHLDTSDDIESIELEVRDTGIGIAPEDVQNLFKPFFQAEAAGPRVIGGTGLGLPIVQRLCMKMGGDISVTSQRGTGTSIHVALRLMVLPAPEPESMTPAPEYTGDQRRELRQRFKVLVVDDHPANRLLLQRQLGFLGFPSETAEDGKQALDMWEKERFDIVITDCSMPVMDGYVLTRTIRRLERERQLRQMPVLGLTAHVQEHERRKALDVGMDECLMKPISVDGLMEALRRHLPDDEHAQALPVAEPVKGSGPFDLASLQDFSGGDARIEASFLEALLRTNITDLEELTGLVQSGAAKEVASCAHKIKGAARIVKAEDVVRDCESLEQASNDGDRAAVAESFAALQRSLGAFNDALSAQLQVFASLAH